MRIGQPKRKLSPERVREIRDWYTRYQAIPSFKDMSRKCGLDPSNLRKVADGRTYRNVP